MLAHLVAVEQLDLAAPGPQLVDHDVRDRALAGAREAGEPQTATRQLHGGADYGKLTPDFATLDPMDRSHPHEILVTLDAELSGPKDACGVFGVYAPGRPVAHLSYLGLYALQHRGQESAGIAVSDGETITVVKDMGLVTQVFDERRLAPLEGHLAIGHVRYSTTGSSTWRNAQPVYRSVADAGFALGHNGNLTNTEALSTDLGMLPGVLTSDSELIGELLVNEYGDEPRSDGRDLEHALEKVLPRLAGAFSLVLMDEAHLFGVRDAHGFRPLVLGKTEGGWVLASETAALDLVDAHYVRDVEPGEMVAIDAGGVRSIRFAEPTPKLCLFEFVYIARPDTQLYGHSVHGGAPAHGRGARAPGAGAAPTW